jgi:hypothetical protein
MSKRFPPESSRQKPNTYRKRKNKMAQNEPEFRPVNGAELLQQLGRNNLLAISGGRVISRESGVTLPISNGYSLTIDLAWNDTYTVRRIFTRSGKATIKAQLEGVYCEDLGDVAYYGSCFRSHPNWGDKTWQDTVNGKESA